MKQNGVVNVAIIRVIQAVMSDVSIVNKVIDLNRLRHHRPKFTNLPDLELVTDGLNTVISYCSQWFLAAEFDGLFKKRN